MRSMRRSAFVGFLAGVFALALAPPLVADQVELRDGSVIVGELVGCQDGRCSIRRATGRVIEVDKGEILRIQVGDERPLPPPSQPAPLRFHGSNTVGETLVPNLVKAWVKELGGGSVQALPGAKENELRFELGATRPPALPAEVTIAAHGSSTAFEALLARSAEIGMSSRPINDAEISSLLGRGDLLGKEAQHVLALDGLAIVAARSRAVRPLGVEEIAGIFSCRIRDWGEVGSRPGPIRLYARDSRSGTFDTFKALVLERGGQKRTLCAEATRFESSGDLSKAVAADENGIGFIGLPYVQDSQALAIDECGQRYKPDEFSVRLEEYPLARRLFLYTPELPVGSSARRFVEFALSEAGQGVVDEVGFMSLEIEMGGADLVEQRISVARRESQVPRKVAELEALLKSSTRISTTFRFRSNGTELDSRAERDIARLAAFLRRPGQANRRVVLAGYADSHGPYPTNLELARRRAEKVAEALRSELGGALRLEILAFGEEGPVACNDSESGKAKNRRVEVWIR
jgi:phosphate transport system substrate-binding protein